MRKKNRTPEASTDLGLGTQPTRGGRLVNKDGSFNVERQGLPFLRSFSIYHSLIVMSWTRFNLIILLLFLTVNLIFGAVYFHLGRNNLMGVLAQSEHQRFMEDVFFSAQTLTTVGYGRISPMGFGASIMAAFESLVGLLGFALGTGLLFARFSRPRARILFSDNALIAPYLGGIAFMFRIANERSNQLIEVDVQVAVSWIDDKATGKRRFHNLPLERSRIDFFALSWTIVHPIDESSPLFGVTAEELHDRDPEFYILIKAFDDIFSQTVHTRYSYKSEEIVWGARFKTIIHPMPTGKVMLDLGHLNDHEPAVLASTLVEEAVDAGAT